MIPINTYTTSLPYNGIILKSSADYFEWIRSVTRHLKATRSYHGFVTPPQEGWEKDPHMVRDQEAAIAFLSCFVSDHVYDRCLANCATAFEAWNSIHSKGVWDLLSCRRFKPEGVPEPTEVHSWL